MEETTTDKIRKANEISTVSANDLYSRGRRFTVVGLIVKPFARFIRAYFCERRFREGLPGLVDAVTEAFRVFLERAKLWELYKTKK